MYAAHPRGDGSVIRITDGARLSVDEILSAFAARQPVGQRYRFVDGSAAAVLDMWEGDPDETGYMGDFADACDILEILAHHTAPPAQVDLEQFRRPVKVAREAMNWAGNTDAVAECDRLLALIDQQAGKGAR